jgi:glycosyltransferase involved in cell wall biosynthesis
MVGALAILSALTIFHLITDLDTGGAEMMLYKLLAGMNRQRFRHVVVSLTDAGSLAARIATLGIPVHALGMQQGPLPLAGVVKLLRLLRREGPAGGQGWLYHASLVGLLAGKLTRVPCIAWNIRCSNMDMRYYSRRSALVVRVLAWFSSLPDAVLINTETGRAFHEGLRYHPRQWHVIPNGFDVSQFHPDPAARLQRRGAFGLPLTPVLIGLIARYDPMKDHLTFLQAANYLLKQRPDVRFVLAGRDVTDDNPDLRPIIQDLGIGDYVHLLGELSEVHELLQGLDIVALTSAFGEGFPNIIGEAMASGVPCAVTDVGDAGYVIGDTGRVVPIRNPQALAEAWCELIDLGVEGRERLGMAARQRVEQLFSLPAIVKQYETLYEALADHPLRASSC